MRSKLEPFSASSRGQPQPTRHDQAHVDPNQRRDRPTFDSDGYLDAHLALSLSYRFLGRLAAVQRHSTSEAHIAVHASFARQIASEMFSELQPPRSDLVDRLASGMHTLSTSRRPYAIFRQTNMVRFARSRTNTKPNWHTRRGARLAPRTTSLAQLSQRSRLADWPVMTISTTDGPTVHDTGLFAANSEAAVTAGLRESQLGRARAPSV